MVSRGEENLSARSAAGGSADSSVTPPRLAPPFRSTEKLRRKREAISLVNPEGSDT